MQFLRHRLGSEPVLLHDVPSQQVGWFCPQDAPSVPQVQYFASAQKPPGDDLKGMQQPVSQSGPVLHLGRQPLKSELVEPKTQVPLQQSLLLESQASPRFLQGF